MTSSSKENCSTFISGNQYDRLTQQSFLELAVSLSNSVAVERLVSTQYMFNFFLFWTHLVIGGNSIKRTCSLHIHVCLVLINLSQISKHKMTHICYFSNTSVQNFKKSNQTKISFWKMAKLIISCLGIHEYPSHPAILLKYVSTRQNIKM